MPVLPNWVSLPEAELAEFFGSDLEGLRRYRLLQAILANGKTQREAAESGQVSERTVRNILHAYMHQGGLDALRSRTSAARLRRERRAGAVERALSTALAEAPRAGGDRLWRRAQELLRDADVTLSRRTAYRILAQLRAGADSNTTPEHLRNIVRSALSLLPEDPPIALANSALAQRFLPTDLEAGPRGMLIQQALRTALDYLRPAGAISTVDRSWWPYLICTGEYEASQSRTEIQHNLALSASTYSRAKRQGIDKMTTLLPSIIERLLESAAWLLRQQLPRTPGFVGRREEQAYYTWRLQTEGVAHIWGLPGSGKTALAAEIAAEGHRYGQRILWHTCRAGRAATLLGIIRGLAQALAGTGDDMVWRQMRQLPDEELDAEELLETLCEHLLLHPVVVVLDDAHHTDPTETTALIDALSDLVARHAARLLLVGRDPIDGVTFLPLPGLIEREAQLLWIGTRALPSEQWRAFYAATAGMPEPILRAAAAYRRAGEQARPSDWSDELEHWARDALWGRLSIHERRLLACVHALDGQPWAERAAQLCGLLAIPIPTWHRLHQHGLLQNDGIFVNLYAALRHVAAAMLQADGELREQLVAFISDLAANRLAAPDDVSFIMLPAALERRTQVALVARQGFLDRLRRALAHSAEYLQEQRNDQVAHQLAAELVALQAALPASLLPVSNARSCMVRAAS